MSPFILTLSNNSDSQSVASICNSYSIFLLPASYRTPPTALLQNCHFLHKTGPRHLCSTLKKTPKNKQKHQKTTRPKLGLLPYQTYFFLFIACIGSLCDRIIGVLNFRNYIPYIFLKFKINLTYKWKKHYMLSPMTWAQVIAFMQHFTRPIWHSVYFVFLWTPSSQNIKMKSSKHLQCTLPR